MVDPYESLPVRRPIQTTLALWDLIARATTRSVAALRFAIGLTALAALADIVSLALLQKGVGQLAVGGAGDHGGVGALAGFIAAALVGTALRLFAQRRTVFAVQAVERDLAIRAFRALQLQDYAGFVRQGASAGFAAFERLNLIFYQALTPFIAVIAALVSTAALLAALAWLYPLAGLLAGIALVLFGAEAALRQNSNEVGGLSELTQTRAVLLYEARSAFRDVFLTNGQMRLCDDFAENETAIAALRSRVVAAAQTSRHTIELAGLAAALMLVLVLGRVPGGDPGLLPLLAVLALAALRLLPQVATLRTSLRLVAFHGGVTAEIIALLDQPIPEAPDAAGGSVRLRCELRVESAVVTRADRPDTLTGLDLVVPRGARIGIGGVSGAGKSTLLDIICGAILPDRGRVLVDGVELGPANGSAWRERIGVVSQTPVLLGRTLREAVTFPDRPEQAEAARFDSAITSAGIAAMVADFEHGLDTPIGEAVAFLSGGQRQRLALAHALYRASDLLILDEATGQLDAASEAAIVTALGELPADLTLIVVSHRAALLECCSGIYELVDGKLRLPAAR